MLGIGYQFEFTMVYGDRESRGQKELLREIEGLTPIVEARTWMKARDFNEIRSPSDRDSRGLFYHQGVVDFNHV